MDKKDFRRLIDYLRIEMEMNGHEQTERRRNSDAAPEKEKQIIFAIPEK